MFFQKKSGIINHKSPRKKIRHFITNRHLSPSVWATKFEALDTQNPKLKLFGKTPPKFHNHQVFTRGQTSNCMAFSKPEKKKQFWVHLDLFGMVNGEFTWPFHMTNPTFGDKKGHGGWITWSGRFHFFSIWPIFFLGKKLMSNFQKCLKKIWLF